MQKVHIPNRYRLTEIQINTNLYRFGISHICKISLSVQIYICLLLALILTSCKKENYSETSPPASSVFSCSGTINGSPINLRAGDNDYYMYSSYLHDANNVYNFIGELKPTGCNTCGNSLKIQIKDFQTSSVGASAQINTSLQPAYYAIEVPGGTATKHAVVFIAQPYNNSLVQSFVWDFGDGNTSIGMNPIHVFTHPGKYNVCLTITYSNACTSVICNTVKVGIPDAVCTAIINSTSAGNNFAFTSTVKGTPPFTYSWDFGDGLTAVGTSTVSHTYSVEGTYPVHLQVKDANNYVADNTRFIATTATTNCFANTKFYTDTINMVANPSAFSNVVINWTDDAGITYTSNNVAQPADSYFKILSVDNYSKNKNGEATKKLHVLFRCKVFNGSSFLQMDNVDAVVAVAYK